MEFSTIKNAINWDKNEVCLEEALVIDQAKVKKAKIMKAFYKNYNTLISIIVAIVATVAIHMLRHSDDILVITISVLAIVADIIIPLFLYAPKSYLNDKIEEVEEESVYTQDFIIFANAMYKLGHRIDGHNDFFYLSESKNAHMMYKLFNLVNIYADQSFLKAYAADDSIALSKLLTPFMDKIIEDTVEAYKKHLKIEHKFKSAQSRDLNAQIELDLSIFEKHNH